MGRWSVLRSVCVIISVMIEELRFGESHQAHSRSHEDTSMKKCNKYYEYNDRDLAQRQLDISACDRSNYSELLKKASRKGRTDLSTSTHACRKKGKKSQESESTIRNSKNSGSLPCGTAGSRTTKRVSNKPSTARDELKYYKRICAEMRKKNEALE